MSTKEANNFGLRKFSFDEIRDNQRKKWCILYSAFIANISKALQNDQFTPSGLEAYTGANGSRL